MRIARDAGEDVAKAVEEGLKAFNVRVADTSDPLPVQIAVRDDDGAIKGGVVARVWLDELYISLVWIDDALRGLGHGRAMMELAEAEGRRLGAKRVSLNTLSWRARPFYESLGYSCIGEVPLMGGKQRRFYMYKDFA